MNTATNYEPPQQGCEAAELPPVLVRVPWLGARQTSSPVELARATSHSVVDRAMFQPHQLVAAADTDVTDFGSVRTHWRIDPPQEHPITAEVHHRRPASASSSPAAAPAPATLPPALPVREVTTPASEGITHLRFDPPQTQVAEPPVQLAQPQPSTSDESSIWHHTVTTLDVVLRRYHRLIMVMALVAAAGLMALVMDGRGPAGDEAPDGNAPHTIDAGDLAAMPLAGVTHAHQPAATPEKVAMVKGPGRAREVNAPATDDQVEAPLMLEPYAPPRESSITPIELDEEPATGNAYPSTGAAAFELTFPPTAGSEPGAPQRARLSQDIQLAPQQMQQ